MSKSDKSAAESAPTAELLCSAYTTILNTLGAEVQEDNGLVSISGQPVTVEKKRLILPTRENLKVIPNNDDVVAFHPLSENIYRGESPVLRRMRRMVSARLSVMMSTLMLELTAIAVNTDMHDKLTAKQGAFLDVMPVANKKTFKAVTSLITNAAKKRTPIMSIYLKRGGKIDGKGFHRVCTIKCNLHAELVNEDVDKPFGVTMSKTDRAAIIALVETLMPELAKGEESIIRVGSKSPLAPYFQSLMLGFAEATVSMNKLIWLMRKHLEDYESIYSNLPDEVITMVGELAKYRDLIPSLPGNEGVTVEGKEDTSEAAETKRMSALEAAKKAAAEAANEEVTVQTAKKTVVEDDDTPPWEEPSKRTVRVEQPEPEADVSNWRTSRSAAARRDERQVRESTGSWRDRGRGNYREDEWGSGGRWGSNAMGRDTRHTGNRWGGVNRRQVNNPGSTF